MYVDCQLGVNAIIALGRRALQFGELITKAATSCSAREVKVVFSFHAASHFVIASYCGLQGAHVVRCRQRCSDHNPHATTRRSAVRLFCAVLTGSALGTACSNSGPLSTRSTCTTASFREHTGRPRSRDATGEYGASYIVLWCAVIIRTWSKCYLSVLCSEASTSWLTFL